MESKLVFTHTEHELLPILEELRQREPIFHSNSVPPRRITNNAQRPTTGRSGHQADAIVAISSCETFTTNLRPLRIHWVGKAGTTPSVALALTLTS